MLVIKFSLTKIANYPTSTSYHTGYPHTSPEALGATGPHAGGPGSDVGS